MAPNRAIASNAREQSSGFCNMHVRKDRRFRLPTPTPAVPRYLKHEAPAAHTHPAPVFVE